MTHDTFTVKVARYLRSKRYQWVRAEALMRIGGQCAWRTRVSNCRRVLNMPIENRVTVKKNGVRVSEYKLGRRKAA